MADDGRRVGPGSPPRLRHVRDIRRVMRGGTSLTSGRAVVYVAPREGPSRAAVVTGKRVGGAVARNRARRLLREAWRVLRPDVEEGHDLVLMARGSFGSARTPELVREIEELFRRAGLIGG